MTIVLSMLVIVQLWASESYSQSTKISLKLENARISDVLDNIENQSEFYFLYSPKLIDVDRKVDIVAEKESISDLLNDLFGSKVKFAVDDRQIILSAVEISGTNPQVQQQKISGIVTGKDGMPLPGVNVVVSGTTIGALTDVEGKYTIQIPQGSKSLTFSFIGMETQVISIGTLTKIDVIMAESAVGLEEVVVVGYGTQRKVSVTGAISTVSSSELTKRSAANVQNLLEGKVTGLRVVQNSGQPGDDGASMQIRGLGTFSSAGSSPLILIDGIQGDLTSIHPDDIATISVLKDASSAAIYGARAANGVILVTTKRGASGAINVEYHGNLQLQVPTRMPKLLTNSVEYMEYYNQANARAGMAQFFTESEIDAYRNGKNDPVKYPNFDWMDFMINNASAQDHHLSINGGNEKTTFNAALGYLDQNGIIGGHSYQRINMLISVDSKVNKVITYGGSIKFINKTIKEPVYSDDNYVLAIYSAGPHYTPYLSDGSGRWTREYASNDFHNRNPLQVLDMGYKKYNNYSVTAQNYVDIKLTKDLTWSTKGSLDFGNNFEKDLLFGLDNYYFKDNSYAGNMGGDWTGVRDYMSQNILTTLFSTLNYTKTVAKDHRIAVLAGYNQESNNYRQLQGARTTFPSTTLTQLNSGASTGQSLGGTANEWAIQSLFGRINYSFKEKYLLETNIRYDGTSRIHKDSRWGLFPSLALGWRMSEEEFMKEYEWIDNFKIRGSWGKLGNQNIGLYPYQDILSTTAYPFSTLQQGITLTRLTDKTLKWETTTVLDLGIDLSLKGGLFTLTADWYNKDTEDILYAIPVPASVGLSSPTVNFAAMNNKGVEFEVGHRNKLGDLNYYFGLNFSANKNEVTKIKAPVYGQTTMQEGLPWGSYYLIEWIGIFQSQEEIAEAPKHPYDPKPGDLKFKDQNNDGVIDAKDRVVVDGAHPKFFYGGNVDLTWKNFHLGAFLQGVSGQRYYVTQFGVDPFLQGTAPTLDFISKMWTPENKTNAAPAMYRTGYGPVTGTASTYYLQNASYLRLKNLIIDYEVPTQISRKIGMKSLRLYVSGDNVFTITKYPGADPERAGDGRFSVYPQLTIYTIGIKTIF